MKNYKLLIPNILTAFRIVITPIMIILGFFNKMPIVIILACLGAITDFFDGYLARLWKTTSKKGAQLDAVADKVFAIGLTSSLAIHFKLIWILVIMEVIIGICNLYFCYRSKKTESLFIGKIKTTILFLTIIIAMIAYYSSAFTSVMYGFIYASINLQLLSLFAYFINFYDNMHPITIEDIPEHQQIMNEVENTLIIDDLQEFVKQLEENDIE